MDLWLSGSIQLQLDFPHCTAAGSLPSLPSLPRGRHHICMYGSRKVHASGTSHLPVRLGEWDVCLVDFACIVT